MSFQMVLLHVLSIYCCRCVLELCHSRWFYYGALRCPVQWYVLELCHSRWFYYYDEAIAAFAELGDQSGAKAQIAGIMEIKYQQAVMLRENGQYEEAIATFLQLGGNSDNNR